MDYGPPGSSFHGIFRQEYGNGLPFAFLGDRPNPGIKTTSPASTALAGPFFTTEPPGSLRVQYSYQMMNDGEQKISQFSLVTQSCPTLCDPMDCSTPGLPVHHPLPESTQTHFHWVGDATLPSCPLSSPLPPALNLSQRQGLFQWVSSSHQVAKVLEFQLQNQSYQSTPRTDVI